MSNESPNSNPPTAPLGGIAPANGAGPNNGVVPQWSPPPAGYPSGPPIAGGPPLEPPTAPTPPVAAPGQGYAAEQSYVPGPVPEPPLGPIPTSNPQQGSASGTSGFVKILVALGLTALMLTAIGVGLSLLLDTVPNAEVTVDQCDITPRGEVIAVGQVTNPDDAMHSANLVVELRSVQGGEWLRTTTVTRPLKAGEQTQWTASATAPGNVERVSCVVTNASLD